MKKENQRIYFCDELRGFAAFIVMIAHYTIGFNALHGFLYNPEGNENIYPSWFLDLLPIDGAFGVAIFFLISGFVIPLSLSKRSPLKFLYARIFRIYPVYIVSALITLLITLFFNLYDDSFGKLILTYLKSITLFRDWIGGVAIDGVVWTLEIEVKFYLYVGLMFFALKKYPRIFLCVPLIVTIISLLIFNLDIGYPLSGLSLNTLLYNFGYLTFMNIGVIVYFHHVQKLSSLNASLWIILSVLVSLLFLYERYNGNIFVLELYILAFVIFITFYKYGIGFRGLFSGFFAKISFPLYAVHSSLGFILLSLFTYKFNINIFISLFLVMTIVIYISWLIHKYIELPSLEKSSRIK
ncbi:MAG: hypothetical protein C0625_12280 [Arcobacter sp.]|nr:MAG: hypothetical protein C0625_12280 [Arcobacter sp.]